MSLAQGDATGAKTKDTGVKAGDFNVTRRSAKLESRHGIFRVCRKDP